MVNSIAPSKIVPNKIRCMIYRVCGIDIQTNYIMPGNFLMWKNIKIGSGSFVNRGCFFDIAIEIGNNCDVGYEVMFCSSTHKIGSKERRAGEGIGKPIKIGDGCWIGARSTILPGVTVGEGCIIAAGSVVNKDCEPNGIYAGVPARRVKDLDDNEELKGVI